MADDITIIFLTPEHFRQNALFGIVSNSIRSKNKACTFLQITVVGL